LKSEEIQNLMGFLDQSEVNFQQIELLFRSSRDGQTAEIFHRLCDDVNFFLCFDQFILNLFLNFLWVATHNWFMNIENWKQKGPTITIIIDSNGNVFGGYSQLPWNSKTGSYESQTESFLFLLRSTQNGKIFPQLFPITSDNGNYSIVCNGSMN